MSDQKRQMRDGTVSVSGKESACGRERVRAIRDGTLSGYERERSSREVECIHSQLKKAHAEENERPEETDERRNGLSLR
jgi:hypothetical protein